ncbi:MAG: hypothetical protein IPM29_03355 [Planctomycetes bacterium]|nr:hypothetical protein [Planctomycetota bacterium]
MSARPDAAPGRRRPAGRHLLLIALLPVLVAVWIPILTDASHSEPPAVIAMRAPVPLAAAAAPAYVPPAAPLGETAASLPIPTAGLWTLPTAELAPRLGGLIAPFRPRWSEGTRRDPFAPVEHSVEPIVAAPASRIPIPSSIVLSRTQPPIAVIGGRVCRQGDEVEGLVVIAIEERRVLFRDGDRICSATLPAPAFGGNR